MSDITYYRNDREPIRVTIRSKSTLLPIDISAKIFVLTVDPAENPTDNANNLVALVGTIEDASNGIALFTPGAADMDFTPGDYWYDVQMEDAGGSNRRTVVKARFYHKQDISK